jgi:RimJ/RimL family protein N-acetyltransferase
VAGSESGAPVTTRIELRDGRTALVAPLHPDDRGRYLVGFERLSAESTYRRFMAPVERLSESQLRYLLEVDHRDHEALLAIDEDGGEAVGVARFVRLADARDVAEAAVTVVDDWQGQGLGKALSQLLAGRARELDIVRFEATLLSENRAILRLLESLGPVRTVERGGAVLQVVVTLPESGIGEQMEGVLRAAATGEVEQLTPPVGLRQLG